MAGENKHFTIIDPEELKLYDQFALAFLTCNNFIKSDFDQAAIDVYDFAEAAILERRARLKW